MRKASDANQKLISDFFLVIIKINSELTTSGRTENNLRTDFNYLSSELYFHILCDVANFGNVLKKFSFYSFIQKEMIICISEGCHKY